MVSHPYEGSCTTPTRPAGFLRHGGVAVRFRLYETLFLEKSSELPENLTGRVGDKIFGPEHLSLWVSTDLCITVTTVSMLVIKVNSIPQCDTTEGLTP
jgi:hypothetical protein